MVRPSENDDYLEENYNTLECRLSSSLTLPIFGRKRLTMKKFYHVVITFHNAVAFRSEEDYLRGINNLAITCLRTDTKIGTFSLMSNHLHSTLYTEDPAIYVCSFKKAHTNYFNMKYHRKGPLMERGFYCVEIKGPAHIEACNSYVLRNSVHHGLTHTPYGYPFNSAACYFSRQLGRSFLGGIDFSKYNESHFLPVNDRPYIPSIMNNTGMISPDVYIEIALTEKQFVSARGFNYCMTRFSGEEWEKAQEKDNNGIKPVTLLDIERPYSTSIDQMLENERGRFDDCRLNDIDICSIIDEMCLHKYGVHSYAELTQRQKISIFERIASQKNCTRAQVARCLELNL